jgi:hypothetical protein
MRFGSALSSHLARFGIPAVALAGVALVGCGKDHQSRLEQIDFPPLDGSYPHLPVPVEACATSTDCEDGDRCTEDRCVANACVSATVPSEECCPADTLFVASFDDPTEIPLATRIVDGSIGWAPTTARAASGEGALHFGDPTSGTYATGARVAGFVELPAVTLPRDRENILSMRVFTEIETDIAFDLFFVTAQIVTPVDASAPPSLIDLGSEEAAWGARIFTKDQLPVAAYEGFALVDVPLAGLAGETVVFRLHFDSLDGRGNDHEGVFLDDVKVESTCFAPLPCTTDDDCTPATENGEPGCLVGACSAEGCAVADTCELPPELSPCDAADAPENCCIADADCDDGNPATLDVCDGATCIYTENPDVCTTDADCDDGDSCTSEVCDGGVCAFRGETGAACCEALDRPIADFDRDTLQGIYVTDNFETGRFWRTDNTRAASGEFALYCGDPVTQTYAFDRRVKSSATTRALSIPAGGETTLVFDLFKHTRTTRHFDVFQVALVRDEGLFPLWSSKDLADGTTQSAWREIRVPLTDYAGQDIQVRFVFDSADAPPAGYEGTYLDSLRLETRCR